MATFDGRLDPTISGGPEPGCVGGGRDRMTAQLATQDSQPDELFPHRLQPLQA
jgi:hypothetical protein